MSISANSTMVVVSTVSIIVTTATSTTGIPYRSTSTTDNPDPNL